MFTRGARGPRRQMRQGRRMLRGMFGLGALFGAGGALADEARRALDHANQLYDGGQYREAGEALAELAELAQEYQRPKRAAQMFYRAYESFLKAKEVNAALAEARQALEIAVAFQPLKAIRLAQRVIADLKAAGFKKEAEEFAKEVNEQLKGQGLPLVMAEAAPPKEQKPHASNCAKCGARLRWLDDDEVECEYCGTVTYA